ncbi:hypothetical protein [Amnibacterium kyonggiense]|uniref:Parallel beta helix pectate lyase-like protein n=1 Tax=Amnibacterium kyonggiense TaxID=595671 RepID=A0A4R7FLH2_9MICO|nr:hypothetical protein [Amnibacterium kyonggiense]TDS77261.1 hypothetical protein CLV52_2204 [Amnibacterium kyonggiense]
MERTTRRGRDRGVILSALAAAVAVVLLLGPTSAFAAGHSRTFGHADRPVITGTTTVGAVLTARPARWAPTPSSWTFQWRRNGTVIAGATGSRYRLARRDAGKRLTVAVSGHRAGFAAVTRTSVRTASILQPFDSVSAPALRGRAAVGGTLSLTNATAWSPAARLEYRWFADGRQIAGAADDTLVVGAAQLGSRITASVRASRAGRVTTTRTAAPTPVVGAASAVQTFDGGTVSGAWSPADADEYRLSGVVTVGTLSLAPGTRILVDPGSTIQVAGSLQALGTASAPVTIESSAPVPAAGDWAGLVALAGATISLQHTEVSDTTRAVSTAGAADSISIRDSTMRRSADGLRIRQGGFTLERSAVDGGVEAWRPDAPSTDGDPLIITNDVLTGGPLFVSSRNTSSTAPPVVVEGNRISDVDSPGPLQHSTESGTVYPMLIVDQALRPSNLTGNEIVGDSVNAIALSGTLVEDWTVPTTGPQFVIDGECCGGGMLEVAPGVRLRVPAGATLKMADRAALWVSGDLAVTGTPSAPAVLTSADDDSAGLPTSVGDVPSTGSWVGVTARFGGVVELSWARIDYAQLDLSAFEGTADVTDSQLLHSEYSDSVRRGSADIERSTLEGGLSVHRSSAQDDPTARLVVRHDVITGGPLVVLSENADPASTPIVVEDNEVGDLVPHTAGVEPTYAIQIWDAALRPSFLTGNSMSGAGQRAFAIGGSLQEDWTLPSDSWHYVLSSAFWPFSDVADPGPSTDPDTALTVTAGHTLSLPAGSVLKVERSVHSDDIEHVFVRGAVATTGTDSEPAIMTTVADDSVGGDLNGDGSASTPIAGEWSGLVVQGAGSIPDSGLDVRYG